MLSIWSPTVISFHQKSMSLVYNRNTLCSASACILRSKRPRVAPESSFCSSSSSAKKSFISFLFLPFRSVIVEIGVLSTTPSYPSSRPLKKLSPLEADELEIESSDSLGWWSSVVSVTLLSCINRSASAISFSCHAAAALCRSTTSSCSITSFTLRTYMFKLMPARRLPISARA